MADDTLIQFPRPPKYVLWTILSLCLICLGGSSWLIYSDYQRRKNDPSKYLARSQVGIQVSAESKRKRRVIDNLKIGYWNIRDFSSTSRTPSEIEQIAKVARDKDCLAICELNEKAALDALTQDLAALGGVWEGVSTPTKVGISPASAEYYGFVYRKDKLRIRGPPFNLARIPCPVPGEEPRPFDRVPAVCFFSTLDGTLDFALIVVHITWGNRVAYRKAEIRALKEYFLQVFVADPGGKRIILGGDFNRDVGDPDSLTDLLKLPSMIDTTTPTPPTMVASEHTYDHILLQVGFLKEYRGEHGVDPFDLTLFSGNKATATKACSDHRPVWIQLHFERDED
jgi:endonuclease/exonuclease/phosphatase family metal-dependent hydrolase